MNSARIVASFEGAGFDSTSIQFWPFTSNWCEGEVGYRSHAVKNSSPYDISIRERVFLNGDGGVFTSRELLLNREKIMALAIAIPPLTSRLVMI